MCCRVRLQKAALTELHNVFQRMTHYDKITRGAWYIPLLIECASASGRLQYEE